MEAVLATASVSITELKQNPSKIIEAAQGQAVAVLNHNRPAAYLIPAKAYEALLERLEDFELAKIVRERRGEKSFPVDLDSLTRDIKRK